MGCERPGADKAGESISTGRPSGAIKEYSLPDLQDKIGNYMPPLEGGSLEIAAPSGWEWSWAGSGYLVGFHEKDSSLNNLPRILVSVEDSPFLGITNVDDGNITELVNQVSKSVAGKELNEPTEPIILGGGKWARYVDFAKKGNAVVARQTLKTVAGGRLYTIRLDVHAPKFSTHEQAAYAVAASMKFFETTESAPPTEAQGPAATTETEEEPEAVDAKEDPSSTEVEKAPPAGANAPG
jgi:hypothetical protein